MFLRVTFSAQQLEVVKVQSDLWYVDCHRIDLDLVMHDHARLIYPLAQTVLTEMVLALCVFVPAILPRLAAIELSREWFSHLSDPAPPAAS